ncbi:DUF2934 domain-containing protein [Rhizobium hidalgonense]|uniref:DUF2934 domain-containing protein n=1 Tax=Rhizobium hidalgonense TaxID=1538159 RepID=A0A2A6K6S9_9HYPH|nr:DUF2934 domain-containing protein [Rhizobium hidalgonense]MDR9771769.1 DUF2934 domain-containing protein [Rhizobium hidalgonense]PDT20151.1 hypothetical protein CO674_28840 [Rhizobium hidalgonense]PON06399.1 hypothetical protein ATY29_16390 [Rhizobium hidalgonense]
MKNPARRKTKEKLGDARPEFSSVARARGREKARPDANETDRHSGGLPATTREEEIRKRAYSLWENEGRPEGRHRHHWTLAEHELDAHELDAHELDAHELDVQAEIDNRPNLAALREALREHTDAFLVKTDLEDADQREASPGTREQS